MRKFSCQCGQPLFFDSRQCVLCKATVRFDPATLTMIEVRPSGEILTDSEGRHFYACQNQIEFGNCNWLRDEREGPGFCASCGFNRTIPNLDFPENLKRWNKLEAGKRRLLYTLMVLALPIHGGPHGAPLFRFDFVEDGRTNPEAFGDEVRNTGYSDGLITVNIVEADDAAREEERLAVNEHYRTVLGHLRHESGHYYCEQIPPYLQPAFANLFGDTQRGYREALSEYYANGPKENWRDHFISAYASAHPLEDWAETWGHYLHINDVLETAVSHGILDKAISSADIESRLAAWRRFSVTLNELNRSVGLGDAYPFVLGKTVSEKLALVDRVVQDLRGDRPVGAIG